MKRLAALAAVYIFLSIVGGAAVAERALHRVVRNSMTAADRATGAALARSLGAGMTSVSVSSDDGAALRGWLFTPNKPNGHSILLLHGIGSNRAAMMDAAGMFLEAGYRTLAVDLRAHGDSDGEFGISGPRDAGDVRQWIAWLQSGQPNGCVYVFGVSLGAGLAVQAADAPGLCAVVAVSVFQSLKETAFDRIGAQLHTGAWLGRTFLRPGVELGFLYVRFRYGLDLAAASAVDAAAGSGAPILLIHGTDDDNTPVRHAQHIQAANPQRVALWLVPGATHENVRQSAGQAYSARILDFLANHRAAR